MAELAAEIARLIREQQDKTGRLLTMGAVESATGGRIADRITNIPGSSDYFKGFVVAYSNEVKIALLGVKKATVESYGAVSEQTALEMVQGLKKLLEVDMRFRYRDCQSFRGYSRENGGLVLPGPGNRE